MGPQPRPADAGGVGAGREWGRPVAGPTRARSGLDAQAWVGGSGRARRATRTVSARVRACLWRLVRATSEFGQAGMVTAELAFASLGAVLMALALSWVLAVLGLALHCQDTAAEVARQEARADREAVALAVADRPDGAQVQVVNRGGRVVVTVRLAAQPWAAWLPAIPLAATATVVREP